MVLYTKQYQSLIEFLNFMLDKDVDSMYTIYIKRYVLYI